MSKLPTTTSGSKLSKLERERERERKTHSIEQEKPWVEKKVRRKERKVIYKCNLPIGWFGFEIIKFKSTLPLNYCTLLFTLGNENNIPEKIQGTFFTLVNVKKKKKNKIK